VRRLLAALILLAPLLALTPATPAAAATGPNAITMFGAGVVGGPTSIVAAPDGNLWFTDQFSGQDRIGRITPSGVITHYTDPNLNGLTDITVGPDNNLWFTGPFTGGSRVGRIDPDAANPQSTIQTWPVNGRPNSIAPGPDNKVWFTGDGNVNLTDGYVASIETDGSPINYYPNVNLEAPRDITPFAGSLWFTSPLTNRVAKVTTAGVITTYTNAAISGPSGITVGGDGFLWVSNTGANDGIVRMNSSGTVLNAFTSPRIHTPVDLTMGSDGRLWITDDTFPDQIVRMSLGGTQIGDFPHPDYFGAAEITSGPDGNIWFVSQEHAPHRAADPAPVQREPGHRVARARRLRRPDGGQRRHRRDLGPEHDQRRGRQRQGLRPGR